MEYIRGFLWLLAVLFFAYALDFISGPNNVLFYILCACTIVCLCAAFSIS